MSARRRGVPLIAVASAICAVCCTVSNPPTDEERLAVGRFLAAAVPLLIERGRALQPGEKIDAGGYECVATVKSGSLQYVWPLPR
jgi:hypothetical protein